MKSLYDYEFLVNEVFYRCWHILDYIEKHPDMSSLDREAIQATIMDALVYKGFVDPERESLDLDSLCIRNDTEHYVFQRHPNVCGIPMWMKEKYRKKCVRISASIPISIYLARPASDIITLCVYDMNTAASVIFSDATFYNVFYTSPTRGVRIETKRPFVEVEIDGELYLIDTLTKRIFKSSFFRETYGFEVIDQTRASEFTGKNLELYMEHTEENENIEALVSFLEMELWGSEGDPRKAEKRYEFEKCRENYPEAFERAEETKRMILAGDIL